LTRKVADVYLAAEMKQSEPAPKPEEKTIPLSQEQLSKFAGYYWDKSDERAIRVAFRDGKLIASLPRRETSEMNPVAPDRFRLARPAGQVRFESTPAGPMKALVQLDGAAPDVYEIATEFHPTPAQFQEFAGAYRSDEIEPVYRISAEEGALVLRRLKKDPDRFRPAVADVFQGPAGSLHFERNPGGRVSGFQLNAGRILHVQFRKTPD
jgi:hypothetical protein